MKKTYLVGITAAVVVGLAALTAEAAPIGVPAATTGAGKSTLGVEVHLLADRDLADAGTHAESTQAFAKGTIGIDKRLDLELRLGFGEFTVERPGTDLDTDVGPAFGVGFKTTWTTLPRSNVKIGSVFQTTRFRVEENTDALGFSEYDAALGAVFDLTAGGKQGPSVGLIPYVGLVWSGLDIEGGAVEDESFGLFLGLQAKTDRAVSFGAEVRLFDETAVSLNIEFPL